MLLNFSEANDNWNRLLPAVRSISAAYKSAPGEMRGIYTAHGNLSLLYTYAYYAGVVQKYAKNSTALLDWGGLYGQVTKLLEEYYPEQVICYLPEVEPNIDWWHKAFSISTIRYKQKEDTAARINAFDGEFDVVLSSGVLEHTYEYGVKDVDALKEINRVLQHGGQLIIWHLPTKLSSGDLINKLFGRYYHVKRYTLDELRWMLALTGFKVKVIEKHDILMPFMRRILSKIVGQRLAFFIDYYLSRIPFISIFSQQITCVAEKVDNYTLTPSYDGKR